MDLAIYNLISNLADEHGFDADEAVEFCEDQISEIKKLLPKEDKASPLDKVRKNVALWSKKLEEDKFKDEVTKAKHIEKIEKEKAKLEKLEPAKVVEKPKEKEKAKEKRIKRFSPQMTTQLQLAFKSVNLEMVDDDKKKFSAFVDDLDDAEFRKSSLADHMKAYVSSRDPPPALEKSDSEDDKEPTSVTLSDLQKISNVATLKDGAFWDADKGRAVTGPGENGDEDFCDEFVFEEKKYIIGNTTGRVYETNDSGDVFAGFVGVGKFKKMTHHK